MRVIFSLYWFFWLLPAFAVTVPDCAGRVEIAHARIIRVEKNGALILNDGRAVMLEGIRLPLKDGGPPRWPTTRCRLCARWQRPSL